MNIEIITSWIQNSIWGMLTIGAIGSILGVIVIKTTSWFSRWLFRQAKRIYRETTSSIATGLIRLIEHHFAKGYKSWRMVHQMEKEDDKYALSIYANDFFLDLYFTVYSFLFLILFTTSSYVFFRNTHPWFCVALTVLTLIWFYNVIWLIVKFAILERFFLKKYRIKSNRFFGTKERGRKTLERIIPVLTKKTANQRVDFTVKTPIDEVKVMRTESHP